MIVLSPLIVTLLTGVVIFACGVIFPKWSRYWFLGIFLVGVGVVSSLVHELWNGYVKTNGLVITDKLALTFYSIFILNAILIVLIFDESGQKDLMYSKFISIALFAQGALFLMVSSTNLLVIFFGFVAALTCFYILAFGNLKRLKFNETNKKILYTGMLSATFLLLGLVFMSGFSGTLDLVDINTSGNLIFTLAVVMLIVSLCIKTGLSPFHIWVPDMYRELPFPVTAFISTSFKTACFAVLLRILLLFTQSLESDWNIILAILAVATMFVGNLLALVQRNLLTMLAYSSIAHTGYILIGIVSWNELGMASVIFYLLIYSLMNIGALSIISLLKSNGINVVHLDDLRGMAYTKPLLAIFMTIFMLALAGLPPVAGFMAKTYLFSSAVKAGKLYLVILAVINSVITICYHLNVIGTMFVKPHETSAPRPKLGYAALIGIILCAISLIGFGLFPSYLMSVLENLI